MKADRLRGGTTSWYCFCCPTIRPSMVVVAGTVASWMLATTPNAFCTSRARPERK